MAIKRAVSLYSLQDEYCRGRMTIHEMYDALEEMGVEGIELISDQMIKGTPNPSETELQKWDDVVNSHHLKSVCNSIFINTTLYKNRVLTQKESADLLIAELKQAKRLGFPLVRLVSMTPIEVVKLALPAAEALGIVMALEIHAAMSFDVPPTRDFCDYMMASRHPMLGLVVDAGIFCRRHPRVSTQYFLSLGLNPEVAAYIDRIFAEGSDPKHYFAQGMPEDLKKLFRGEIDFLYSLYSDGYENCEFSILDPYLPYIKHIHGKCFEFLPNGEEYSIDYPGFIEYLASNHYDGYIATEYEGNRFVLVGQTPDGLANVRAHQALLKRSIDQAGGTGHV